MSTGVLGARRISSVPGSPGSRRSLMISAKSSRLWFSTASCTAPASLTWYWWRSSSRRSAVRMMGSSSTTRICDISTSCGSRRRGQRLSKLKDAIAGQGNGEPGSPLSCIIDGAVYRYLTIMLLDDRVHQRQPEPGTCTRLLGREKRLEQPILQFRLDATALVLDRQQYLVLIGKGANGDAVTVVAGISGVAQQVDQHLHQPLAVTGYPVSGIAQVNIDDLRALAVER